MHTVLTSTAFSFDNLGLHEITVCTICLHNIYREYSFPALACEFIRLFLFGVHLSSLHEIMSHTEAIHETRVENLIFLIAQ